MDIREVDRGDVQALHRFWEIGKAAEAAYRAYDFYPAWEAARPTYEHGHPGSRNLLLGGFEGDTMVGRAYVQLPDLDNTHLAFVSVHVQPHHQRRGVGRALVDQVARRVRSDGRRLLVAEAYSPIGEDGASLKFARAAGFTEAIEDSIKIVDLEETEPTWDALEREVAGPTSGYLLVGWQDVVPPEHVASYCAVNAAFNEEAPMGELEVEPEVWDEKRVRLREERNRAAGRHVLAVAAIAPDGSLAGFTEVDVSSHSPHRGFQSGTLVLREHRGHRLGLAMKLVNHRAVRAAFPECRVLLTGNAGVNVAMNAVNDRLGYRDIERCVEVQKELTA